MSEPSAADAGRTETTENHDGRRGSAAALSSLLAHWLPTQRWFSGKGDQLVGVSIEARTDIAEFDGRVVEQVLFMVPTPSGQQRYQLWVGWSADHPDRLGHVMVIGESRRALRL